MSAKRIIISLIKIYQKTISPDHSFLGKLFPYFSCRFYPSCSEYAAQAIEKYGIRRGIWMSIKRVLRCHPFDKGGVDYP